MLQQPLVAGVPRRVAARAVGEDAAGVPALRSVDPFELGEALQDDLNVG